MGDAMTNSGNYCGDGVLNADVTARLKTVRPDGAPGDRPRYRLGLQGVSQQGAVRSDGLQSNDKSVVLHLAIRTTDTTSGRGNKRVNGVLKMYLSAYIAIFPKPLTYWNSFNEKKTKQKHTLPFTNKENWKLTGH